jgi:uncharacterized membrane protein YhaH (DUF805 family)
MNYKWLLFSFTGRIGRQTYWLCTLGFFLFFFLISMLLGSDEEGLRAVPMLVVMLVSTFMGFAVAAKRWHDRDKSGWWSLIAFVPIVGGLWMLIELGFLPGTRGPNRFGPDPIGPLPVVHEGRTYYRHSNGTFTDAAGNPVTNVALVGALGAAHLVTQSATAHASSNSALDRVDSSSTSGTTPATGSGSGSWWSGGGRNSGGTDGWSSGSGSGDSGGGAGGD